MNTIIYRHIDTAWGAARVARRGDALAGLWFVGQKHDATINASWREAAPDDALLNGFEAQFREYERGRRTGFDLRLEPQGTPFQQLVWQALQHIDYGTTVTYGEIARRIDRPRAVRAVGAAIGRNPLSVVIPCHRVLGSSGSLTGYAGGVERKQALLQLEGVGAS